MENEKLEMGEHVLLKEVQHAKQIMFGNGLRKPFLGIGKSGSLLDDLNLMMANAAEKENT